MDTPAFAYFALIIIAILLLSCLYVVLQVTLVYLNKKVYTRERFVTFAFGSFTLLVSGAMAYFYNANFTLLINPAIDLLNELFHLKIRQIDNIGSSTHPLVIIGTLICLYWVYSLIKSVFLNWNGQRSIRQENETQFDKAIAIVSMLSSVKAYLSNDDSVRKYDAQEQSKNRDDLELPILTNENLVWHEQVAQLIPLMSEQYKIDSLKDWFREGQCFISDYGKNQELIGVYCLHNMPTETLLNSFFDFIERNRGEKNIYKLIVAIKEDFEEEPVISCKYRLEFFSESQLFEELIDFSYYKKSIIDKFEKNEIIEGYKLKLNDVYVPSNATVFDRKEYKKNENDVQEPLFLEKNETIGILNIEEYIKDWLCSKDEKKQLAILGEYGQGKSVLAQRICYLIFNTLFN